MLNSRRGFTLIELSIVLAIIAVVLGSGMAMLVASTQAAQYNATINTMNTIEQALLNYTVAFNRLPCPSNLTVAATSTSYGIEAANPGSGNCIGGTPAANYTYQAAGNTYMAAEGGVPTISLKLPDSYMYDAWGRRIRYAVDTSLTAINTGISSSSCNTSGTCIGTSANAALPPPVGALCTASTTGMTVYDKTGVARTANAAYVLVSHGANGHGAYTANGTTLNIGTASAPETNTGELANCHCSGSTGAATGSYTAAYYQEMPTSSTVSNPLAVYDDVVTFKEYWQLRAANSPAVALSCPSYIYVADSANNRIEEFNDSGSYVKEWTGLTAPKGIIFDSSGNMWVGETFDVKEITPGGTTTTYSSNGNTQGFCHGIEYLAFDNSTPPNLWVVNFSSNNVQEFQLSPSWGFVNGIGCGFNGNSSCSQGSSGSATNDLNEPNGMVIDSNNNVWISDGANGAVKEFSVSLTTGTITYVREITGFNFPAGLIIDPSGNYLWVADSGNGRLLEYPINPFSSTPVTTISGVFASNSPDGIDFDSLGNIWVGDYTGSQLYKCTTAGACTSEAPSGSATGDVSKPEQVFVTR